MRTIIQLNNRLWREIGRRTDDKVSTQPIVTIEDRVPLLNRLHLDKPGNLYLRQHCAGWKRFSKPSVQNALRLRQNRPRIHRPSRRLFRSPKHGDNSRTQNQNKNEQQHKDSIPGGAASVPPDANPWRPLPHDFGRSITTHPTPAEDGCYGPYGAHGLCTRLPPQLRPSPTNAVLRG